MKLITYFRLILVEFQKAILAAHFARLGQRDRATDIITRG